MNNSAAMQNTYPLLSVKGVIMEISFITTAVLLPSILHLIPGINVFALLPMHWTIILAGLVLGWKGGLLAGLTAPIISFALTGMPFPAILPLITVELALYGFSAGLLKKQNLVNCYGIVAISAIAGRLGFLLMAIILGKTSGGIFLFMQTSFLIGVPALIAQIILLPKASEKIISRLG